MDAATLCAGVREDLRDVEAKIRDNRWLAEAEAGRLPVSALRAFAGEQLAVIPSDERSFTACAQRFGDEPAHGYLTGMAAGERVALAALDSFATAVGLDADARARYEPQPGCQAYPSYVARLARDGSPAEVAGAFLVNLEAWGDCCRRLHAALGEHYGLGEADRAFLAHFAGPTDELERISLEVIDAGLAAGVPAAAVARAARLLQAYELQFWGGLPC
ncbi:hypothetical protein [Pseudonocardia acaciae]|uniref:hypothetical protein n=1 Tax=Pseudonocardia acaciae TaxID=551276 RepID=UPI00068560EE|nr:hypothetical protein [Pseudonocardia acaciae]